MDTFPSRWFCRCFPDFINVPVIVDGPQIAGVLQQHQMLLAPGAAASVPPASSAEENEPSSMGVCTCLPAFLGITEKVIVYVDLEKFREMRKAEASANQETPESPRPMEKSATDESVLKKDVVEKILEEVAEMAEDEDDGDEQEDEEDEQEFMSAKNSFGEDAANEDENEESVDQKIGRVFNNLQGDLQDGGEEKRNEETPGEIGARGDDVSAAEKVQEENAMEMMVAGDDDDQMETDDGDDDDEMLSMRSELSSQRSENPVEPEEVYSDAEEPFVIYGEREDPLVIYGHQDVKSDDEELPSQTSVLSDVDIPFELTADPIYRSYEAQSDSDETIVDGNDESMDGDDNDLKIDERPAPGDLAIASGELQIDTGDLVIAEETDADKPPLELKDPSFLKICKEEKGLFTQFVGAAVNEGSKKKQPRVEYKTDTIIGLLSQYGVTLPSMVPKPDPEPAQPVNFAMDYDDDETTFRGLSPAPKAKPEPDYVELSSDDDEPVRPARATKRRRIRRRYGEDEAEDEIQELTYEDYHGMSMTIGVADEFCEVIEDEELAARIAEKRRAREAAKKISAKLNNFNKMMAELSTVKSVETTRNELFAQSERITADKVDLRVRKFSLRALKTGTEINPVEFWLQMSRHPSIVIGGYAKGLFNMTSMHQIMMLAEGLPFTRLRELTEVPYCGYLFHRRISEQQPMADFLNKISNQPKRTEPDHEAIVIRLVNKLMKEKQMAIEAAADEEEPVPATDEAPLFYIPFDDQKPPVGFLQPTDAPVAECSAPAAQEMSHNNDQPMNVDQASDGQVNAADLFDDF